MKVTIKEFAEQRQVSVIEAGAILRFMADAGYAKRGSIKGEGRGRPVAQYTFAKRGSFTVPAPKDS